MISNIPLLRFCRQQPVGQGEWTAGEVEIIKDNFQIITTKPIVYLVNLNKRDFCMKRNKHLPRTPRAQLGRKWP